MKKNVWMYIFLLGFISNAFCTGFEVKTSPIIDQPGVEVLGDYKGSWYVVAFEKPGNLNKPPRYKILKYNGDFHNGKSSPMYPSFGEKTLYLRAAFVNNKISLFYARCDRRVEENDMMDGREGHRQIPVILRQDYDPNTLDSVGGPQVVFDEDADRFAASGIDIAESEDKSKTAMLIKCYYRQQKYKMILTDNKSGQLFAKVFDLKPMKEFLKFQNLKVNNGGQVLVTAKVREDVITLQDKTPVLYYFFSIDKKGAAPKIHTITSPIQKNAYSGEPVTAMLSNGEIAIAYSIFPADKNPVVKAISVNKFDVNFNSTGIKDIVPDPKFIPLTAEYANTKKENGLPYLELKQMLPLEGGNFMLIAEFHRTTENADKHKPSTIERHYILTYKLDDKLTVKDVHFIPKKQTSTSLGFALSTQVYRKGNEVYLIHNDDWESDTEHDTNLQCTRIPANGTEPETKKIGHTSDDFFTSMEHIFPRSDGKFLMTEEKLVDFENVSREVKLLEVTIK